MTTFKIIILLMCLFSGYLSPLSYPLFFNNETPSTPVVEGVNNEVHNDEIGYNINGFLTTELEGYCTIDIPQSHWSIVSSDLNTQVQKYFKYEDGKSRMLLGYATNLDEKTDVPGYIVQEAAQVDMTTNNRKEVEYPNGTWMIVSSNELIDGANIEVWYKLSSDNKSAFWFRLSKDPEINEDELKEVIDSMIKTFNIYYISGGTLFNVPDTGIYSESSGESNNTEDYKTNDKDNTVFQGRGGFITNADISDNWKDMEIILDGNKIKLPCTLEDLGNAGFTIRSGQYNLDSEVPVNNKLEFDLANDNGTVIKVGAYNNSVEKSVKISECLVYTLEADSNKFLSLTDDTQNNHELIIAGGATWDVYADDLKALYGSCKTTDYDLKTSNLIYQHENNYMLIRIGKLKGIQSIYMSVIGN